jgi:hypothetical protein
VADDRSHRRFGGLLSPSLTSCEQTFDPIKEIFHHLNGVLHHLLEVPDRLVDQTLPLYPD